LITEELMASLPNLKVISNIGAGIDNIDLEAAKRRGILVGNTPGISDCLADFAWALLMAAARNVIQADAMMRKPGFKIPSIINWHGTRVSGATLGIIGLGNIGLAVAKRAKGFDMRILYYNRTRKMKAESELGVHYCSGLKDLLKESDYVMLSCALTPETRHIIKSAELSQMKPSATLINVARGGLVNHDDLTTALQNGVIRGAALDATDPEPLPHDHPLLALSNAIVTPHIASATLHARRAYVKNALLNVNAGLRGDPLPFPC
ncbi:predicted protein, partial [Nematostella vectensis]